MGDNAWPGGAGLFQPADGPGEAVAAIEEIGLVSAAEIAIEMSDAGVVGTFEIEDHG